MNIYKITEDGDDFCIKADNMSEACKLCEDRYIEDRMEDYEKEMNKICSKESFESVERKFYKDEILFSCELIGRLAN